MTPLRHAIDIRTGEPIDRDTRRKPIGSIVRRGILSGHWDGGNVVGMFRGGCVSFIAD